MKANNINYCNSATVTINDLTSLVTEEVVALVVEGYLPTEVREHCLEAITQYGVSNDKQFDGGAPINRIGQPWFTTKHGEQAEQEYFEKAKDFHTQMRSLCAPYLPPVERVIRDLDNAWPGGAMMAKIDQKAMCAGLVRDITDGKALPWHVDANRFGPDGKRGTILDQVSVILFGNVYMETDGQPGGLQCIDKRPNPLGYAQLNDTGFGSSQLEATPDFDHLPKAGALILGHADKWHRVLETKNRRITTSFFVAVYGIDKPMLVYS